MSTYKHGNKKSNQNNYEDLKTNFHPTCVDWLNNSQFPNSKDISGSMDQGKATFTYYQDEKTGNDVRHGAFKFNESSKSEESSSSRVISGIYKHGFKDGVWSHTINNVDVSIGSNVYQTGSITLTAEYNNGMPNGAWKYTSNFKLRKKLFSLLGWSIILAHFKKVFGVDIEPSNRVEINNITDYYLWNTICHHDFDQKRIAQEIKDLNLYSEKTKGAMGKQMKKVSAMIQAYLNQSHNTDHAINQIKELIS